MSLKNVRAFWVAALAKIQSHQRDKFSACAMDNPRCLCIRSQGYSAMSAMLYVSPQIYFWEFGFSDIQFKCGSVHVDMRKIILSTRHISLFSQCSLFWHIVTSMWILLELGLLPMSPSLSPLSPPPSPSCQCISRKTNNLKLELWWRFCPLWSKD